MTYCVAAVVASGIVFASDSRINAGVDQIAIYSRMKLFETPGERLVVMLSAGNLATTQSVTSLLALRAAQLSGYWSASLRRVFAEAPDVSWS